jgi:hypothetical protein
MFLTQDHPTSIVFNEVTKQICEILDLEYNCNIDSIDENITTLTDSVYSHPSHQYPISRYAINYFNFEYIKTEDNRADQFYRNNLHNYYSLHKK